MGAAAALLKLIPTVAGWIGTAVSTASDKTRAQLQRQAAIANGRVGLVLVLFWFYPAIANYIPVLRESAGVGFKLLAASPDWYWQLLIGITFVILGLGKPKPEAVTEARKK